jgi:NAD(P)-dependent dehydrogenase (short-subunit alcohol dehydrogenase family)
MGTNGIGNGQIVVITGASTGIGRASALRLDAMGFQVMAGVRKPADGEALAEGRPRIQPLIIDVTDEETIRTAAGKVEATAGDRGIAGLVNNAGIGVGGPMEFVPMDELRRQFEVNLFGQVAMTQAFLPLLRKGRGRIVNIGSIGGRLASPFIAPYSASKFALEAITDALRIELRPWGINVAIVEPGSIATDIWDKAKKTTDDLERDLSPEAHALYGETIGAVRTFIADAEKRAIPADRVAKAVAHALTAKRPKTRYLVGTDARMQAAAATVLPDRVMDRLILRQLKIGSN